MIRVRAALAAALFRRAGWSSVKQFPSLRNLSLRRKLPLLVLGSTAGALVLAGALAYVEVRTAAIEAAEDRLASIVSDLTALMTVNLTNRASLEQRIASAPVVRAALSGTPLDTAALAGLLDSLRTPSEVGMPISLVREDGSVVFGTGFFRPAMDPDPVPPREEERAYGPYRSVDGRIVYWLSVPVPGDGKPAAWIAQRRAITPNPAGGALTALLGDETKLFVGTLSDSLWLDIEGGAGVDPTARVLVGRALPLRHGRRRDARGRGPGSEQPLAHPSRAAHDRGAGQTPRLPRHRPRPGGAADGRSGARRLGRERPSDRAAAGTGGSRRRDGRRQLHPPRGAAGRRRDRSARARL
jgi:hypothetical protein